MKFIITQENAQKILDYLTGRPYNEVFQLIPIFQELENIPEPPTPTLVVEEEVTTEET
jgi:hypothetical protein